MSVDVQGIPNNSIASKNTLPLSNPPMPVQKNNSDCSVFMLQFIKCFKSAYPYKSPSSVIPALNNVLPPDLKKHQIKSVLSQWNKYLNWLHSGIIFKTHSKTKTNNIICDDPDPLITCSLYEKQRVRIQIHYNQQFSDCNEDLYNTVQQYKYDCAFSLWNSLLLGHPAFEPYNNPCKHIHGEVSSHFYAS